MDYQTRRFRISVSLFGGLHTLLTLHSPRRKAAHMQIGYIQAFHSYQPLPEYASG